MAPCSVWKRPWSGVAARARRGSRGVSSSSLLAAQVGSRGAAPAAGHRRAGSSDGARGSLRLAAKTPSAGPSSGPGPSPPGGLSGDAGCGTQGEQRGPAGTRAPGRDGARCFPALSPGLWLLPRAHGRKPPSPRGSDPPVAAGGQGGALLQRDPGPGARARQEPFSLCARSCSARPRRLARPAEKQAGWSPCHSHDHGLQPRRCEADLVLTFLLGCGVKQRQNRGVSRGPRPRPHGAAGHAPSGPSCPWHVVALGARGETGRAPALPPRAARRGAGSRARPSAAQHAARGGGCGSRCPRAAAVPEEIACGRPAGSGCATSGRDEARAPWEAPRGPAPGQAAGDRASCPPPARLGAVPVPPATHQTPAAGARAQREQEGAGAQGRAASVPTRPHRRRAASVAGERRARGQRALAGSTPGSEARSPEPDARTRCRPPWLAPTTALPRCRRLQPALRPTGATSQALCHAQRPSTRQRPASAGKSLTHSCCRPDPTRPASCPALPAPAWALRPRLPLCAAQPRPLALPLASPGWACSSSQRRCARSPQGHGPPAASRQSPRATSGLGLCICHRGPVSPAISSQPRCATPR